MIWPYIIVRMTQVIFLQFTGKVMPTSTIQSLRRELKHVKERI